MKRLTIRNLSIQIDMPDSVPDDVCSIDRFIQESIELINLTLQREPYNLAAQVFQLDNTSWKIDPVDFVDSE